MISLFAVFSFHDGFQPLYFFFSLQNPYALQVSKGQQVKYKTYFFFFCQQNIAAICALSGNFMEACLKSENLNIVSLNCGLDSPSTWKCAVWC